MARDMYQAYILTTKALDPATTNYIAVTNPAMKNLGFKETLDPTKDAESGGNTAFMYTKQWYYLQVGLRIDSDSLKILADVVILSPSNPYAVAMASNVAVRSPAAPAEQMSLKTDFQTELKDEPTLTLDKVEVLNINISISNMKIYAGNFGDFLDSTNLAEPSFVCNL